MEQSKSMPLQRPDFVGDEDTRTAENNKRHKCLHGAVIFK